jgi:hypothetical protein
MTLVEKISEAIKAEKKICIRFYSLSDKIENWILFILRQILNKYDKLALLDVLYSSIKELAINATKANIKRLVYAEHNMILRSLDDHYKGLVLFRSELNEKRLKHYGNKARAEGLMVEIKMDYDQDRFLCIVHNNLPIREFEDEIIRNKFRKATSYDDLIQFFIDHPENNEGAGLGITMVTTLLKNSNIDHHNFVLYGTKDDTRAKLEIPFNSEYKTSRQRYLESQKNKS